MRYEDNPEYFIAAAAREFVAAQERYKADEFGAGWAELAGARDRAWDVLCRLVKEETEPGD